jgi:quinol-cytochrome oxidoreductase complex cytochrome b subunit/coenzyme F420-reducing hydrogenase delta subunit
LSNQIRNSIYGVLRRVEDWYGHAFGQDQNPFTYLGAMTIYLFWIVLVTGLYLFLFFEMNVTGAYHSVEWLTHEQWYLGGVMRSLHRYASDAAVIAILLHVVREFLRNRYRGPRWYSWFTGVPLLWMVTLLGITGYWLVWDELAQYIAIGSAQLLDALPIFTDPMARNFLTEDSLSDRFFTLMAFLHLLGIPIFLIMGIWFHVLRVVNPRINPPRRLMAGTLVALIALSLAIPAVSHEFADLGTVPTRLNLDWFYLAVYPIIDLTSPAFVWGLLAFGTLFVSALPWLPPEKKQPVAEVDLNHCSGCTFCALDCPYGAITLVERTTDGKRPHKEAVVDPAMCVSCGICTGSCPQATPFRKHEPLATAIDLPQFSLRQLYGTVEGGLSKTQQHPRVMVYGCDFAAAVEKLDIPGVTAVSLPCIGLLPPSLIEYTLRDERADGIFITGCCSGDCQYRLGNTLLEERIRGEREPRLRARVDRQRIRVRWASMNEPDAIRAEIEDFMAELQTPGEPGEAASTRKEATGRESTGAENV